MSDQKVQIVITTDATGSVQAIRTITRDLGDLEQTTQRVGTNARRNLEQVTSCTRQMSDSLGQLKAAMATAGIAAYLKQALEYMSTLETASLGIAAAFLVGGKYTDQITGKVLKGQAALVAAQQESVQVMEQLKVANMQTTATLDQLVKAYQVTLPVAMAKGFNKQQVMDFTTAMVQAAGAIGLPFQQLGEESRSLLTGEIRAGDSRIAQVLGLRKADIEQFKGNAQGLFDFLMQRLEGFRIAGIASQQTWEGLWSNWKDIQGQASGMAFQSLFDSVKYELSEIIKHIYTIDEKAKTVAWNPDFINGVTQTRETITAVIAEVYRLSMLIDKAAGSMTSFGSVSLKVAEVITRFMTIGQFGDSLKAGSEKMSAWNKMYEDRYKELERSLQALANREVGLDADGNPLKKAVGKANYTANPAKPDAEAAKQAAHELAELQKYNDARLASIAAYRDRVNALTKQQSQLELAALKARHEQGLVSEVAFLEQSAAIRVKEAEDEIQQLSDKYENQFNLMEKLRKKSQEKGIGGPDGRNTEQYSAELTKTEKALEGVQLARGRLQLATQEGQDSIQGYAVKAALAIQDTMTKAWEFEQKLRADRAKTAADLTLQLAEQRGLQETALQLQIDQENAALRLNNLDTERVMILKDQVDVIRKAKLAADRTTALTDKQTATAILNETDPNQRRLMELDAAHKKELDNEYKQQQTLLKIRYGASDEYAKYKEQYDAEIQASSDKIAALEKNNAAQTTDAKLAIATGYIDTYSGLMKNLAGAIDQSSRDGFESAKALNIATAIMDTASAIIKSYAQLGPVAGTVAAVMVAAVGAMQISKIASTSYGGGGSAPAFTGSVGSFGTGSGGGSMSGSAIGSPTTAIRDRQSYDSLKQLADSSTNASLALDKVSAGLTNLANLFSTGSMAGKALNMSPGISLGTNEVPGMFSKIGSWLKDTLYSSVVKELYNPIFGALGAVVRAFSHGPWLRTMGGFSMNMAQGDVGATGWGQYGRSGGLFGGTENQFLYENSVTPEFVAALNAEMRKVKTQIIRSAAVMGTSVDFSNVSAGGGPVITSGRKPEEIATDVNSYFASFAGALAQTMKGLEQFTYYGESAYDAAIRLVTSLQGVNEALQLIGATLLDSTLQGASTAYTLADAFGGMDKLQTSVATYFKAMFTDTEQAARTAEQATRQYTTAFNEMNAAYQDDALIAIPKTREEFRALVDGLDLTTERGRALFASLMGVSEAFGTAQDQAQKLAETDAKQRQDLTLRRLTATGQTAQADLASLRYQQLQEIKDFQGDTTDLLQVQQLEYQNLVKETTKSILTAASATKDKLNSLLSGQIGVGQTLQSILTGDAAGLSSTALVERLKPLFTATVNRAQLGDAAAMSQAGGLATELLSASRNTYASGAQYWADYSSVTSALGQLIGLGAGQGSDPNAVSKQVANLTTLQDAVAAGNLEQIAALRDIYTANSGALVLLTDLLAESRAQVAQATAIATATIAKLDAVEARLAGIETKARLEAAA